MALRAQHFEWVAALGRANFRLGLDGGRAVMRLDRAAGEIQRRGDGGNADLPVKAVSGIARFMLGGLDDMRR